MIWKYLLKNLFTRPAPAETANAELASTLKARFKTTGIRRLGRDLSIRHIAAGSCNGCELELRATQNLVYDLTQYGFHFTQSPHHADILLITGVANLNMREAVLQTRAAMPDPVLTIAVGDCAIDGGVFKGSSVVGGGASSFLPVDLVISGCAPTPQQIIRGLLALLKAQDKAGTITNKKFR